MTRVLVLTTFDSDDYVHDALHAGASGFPLMSSPAEQLVGAIRVVAGGDSLLAPSIARRVVEQFVQQRPRPCPPPQQFALTDREREVMLDSRQGVATPKSPSRSSSANPRSRRTSPGY